jgi:hypothetical protein
MDDMESMAKMGLAPYKKTVHRLSGPEIQPRHDLLTLTCDLIVSKQKISKVDSIPMVYATRIKPMSLI